MEARRLRGVDGEPDAEEEMENNLAQELQKGMLERKVQHQKALDLCRKAGHSTVFLLASMLYLFPENCKRSDGKFDGIYVDCTFGRGGHSREILGRLSSSGRLYAFDIDPSAAECARVLEKEDERFTFFQRPFGDISEVLAGTPINGVLMDIGISSPQVDRLDRGLSLNNLNGPERPLDLRMNPSAGISAADFLRNTTVEELANILNMGRADPGGQLMAERCAQAILDDQEQHGPYDSMRRFCQVVGRTQTGEEDFEHPWAGMLHPARMTIAALRKFINREDEQLAKVLPEAFALLVQSGRCLVSAFKPDEEHLVRTFTLEHEEPDPLTVKRVGLNKRLRELYPLVGKPVDFAVRLMGRIQPSQAEVLTNRRARTGALYVLEKVPRQPMKRVKGTPRSMAKRLRPPTYVPELIKAEPE